MNFRYKIASLSGYEDEMGMEIVNDENRVVAITPPCKGKSHEALKLYTENNRFVLNALNTYDSVIKLKDKEAQKKADSPTQERRHLQMYGILTKFLICGSRYINAAKSVLGDYTLQSHFFTVSNINNIKKMEQFTLLM